ncbi:UNVERIFIED_CONTAM: hypothetical protein RMT77_013754 [Armadillidium vulgare]
MTSDVTEDDVAHNSLVDEIRKINSIDRKKSKRTQLKNVRVTRELEIPSKKLGNILSTIGGKTKQKRKLEPLIEPLDKPKAKRLQREAGFEHVAIEANKWAGVVQERKRADQLHFPLEKVDLRVITSEKNYKPLIKTDLEKMVYELLDGTALETQEKVETEEEKTIKKAMSLKDIRERSTELMKNRNLKMRLERKAALLNKSKSRKYHKILRRERLKRLKQEYENLKATNPEAALEILDKIEKTRVKERMDLRHKRSRWLNLLQSRASRDERIRELLKENKEIRQEMLEKLKFLQESDVENDNDEESDSDQNEKISKIKKDQAQAIKNGKFDSENLWVKQLAVPNSADSNPDESFYKMKKYWEDRHEEKQRELEALKVVKEYEKKQKRSDCNEKEEEVEENEEAQKANKEDEIEEEEEEEEIEIEGERNVNKPDKKKEKSGKVKTPKKITQMKIGKKSKLKKVSTNNKNINETGKQKKLKKKENKNKNKETKHKITEVKTKITNSDTDKQTKISKKKENENKIKIKENRTNKINKEYNEETEVEKQRIENENEIVIQNNLKKKEIKSSEEKPNNQPHHHFSKIEDRKLGSAKHDRGFLKRILNNDESDSEKEDFEDIFADVDYAKEFQEEKKEHEESRKLKDIDNFKAGWGSWGGPGIVISEKRKKRFRIKAPKTPSNKYSKVGNVIYKGKV